MVAGPGRPRGPNPVLHPLGPLVGGRGVYVACGHRPQIGGWQQEGPVLQPDPREDVPAGLPSPGRRSFGWLSELVQQVQRYQVHGYRLALASVLPRAAGVFTAKQSTWCHLSSGVLGSVSVSAMSSL